MSDSPATTQPSPRENAIRRCSELLRRTMLSQSILTSALEIPRMSNVFKDRIFRDHVTGATGMRELLGELTRPELYNPERDFPKIARALAEQAAVNGEMVISAAVVVLSHSTADDVFTAACDMAVELDPEKWISELNMERTITLTTLREEGRERIFQLELERFRKQLPDKSLPKRAELFFRRVQIVQNRMYKATDSQYYRAGALKEADDLRNDIVHRNALPHTNLKQSTDMMLFLHEAATTALRSLGSTYVIPLDRAILFSGFSTTDLSASLTAAAPPPRRPRDRE